MRNISDKMKALMAVGTQHLSRLTRITLTNGTVYHFTDAVEDILFGGDTYLASSGFDSTSIKAENGFNVEDIDIEGFIPTGAFKNDLIKDDDLINEVWDFATFETWVVDRRKPDDLFVELVSGTLGEMQFNNRQFYVEFRSKMAELQNTIGKQISTQCRVRLGSIGWGLCNVPLVASQRVVDISISSALISGDTISVDLNGTVYSQAFVTSNDNTLSLLATQIAGDAAVSTAVVDAVTGGTENDRKIRVTSAANSNTSMVFSSMTVSPSTINVTETVIQIGSPGYIDTTSVLLVYNRRSFLISGNPGAGKYKFGTCKFLTGLNAGKIMEIRLSEDTADSTRLAHLIELFLPMGSDISIGDSVELAWGCDKSFDGANGCAKFNNKINFQGEPHLPTTDEMMARPSGR